MKESEYALIQPLIPPDRVGTHQLTDGRALAWYEWGHPDGIPVIFCTGAAMSGSMGFGSRSVAMLGLRLIGFDRPGLGRSTYDPHKSLKSWAVDIQDFLATATKPGSKPLALGFSQGAPFALSLAAQGVVAAVALVSGQDEFADVRVKALLRDDTREFVARIQEEDPHFLAQFAAMADAAGLVHFVVSTSSELDRAIYSEPSFHDAYLRCVTEGLAQGPKGYIQDLCIALGPWPFKLSEIAVPLSLWFGSKDQSTVHSPDFGKSLSQKLMNATLHVIDEAGGSILWTHAEPILQELERFSDLVRGSCRHG